MCSYHKPGIQRVVALACTAVWLGACASSPQAPVLAGGKSANQAFIGLYDSARTRANRTVPLAVLALPQALVVVRHGQITERLAATTPAYTALKEVSHLVLALFLAAWNTSPADAAEQTAAYAPHVEALSKGLAESAIPEADHERQRQLLAAARELIREAAANGGITQDRLTRWAREVSAALLENAYDAARSQLKLINREMTRLVQSMSNEEKTDFVVVVGSSHQARENNIQMLYFQTLLGPGATVNDHRLLYAESVYDAKNALDLLGTHVLDRAIASAFFASPNRMQKDLLGNAAERIIPTLAVPRLDP